MQACDWCASGAEMAWWIDMLFILLTYRIQISLWHHKHFRTDVWNSQRRTWTTSRMWNFLIYRTGKAKAGMVHSVSGWTRGVQVKLWDPLRTRAIPERLRCAFKTRRYTNTRLHLHLHLLWVDTCSALNQFNSFHFDVFHFALTLSLSSDVSP